MISFPQTYLWIHDKYSFTSFKQRLTALGRCICIGNSMIWSDIWYKYHKWYFQVVIRNFKSGVFAKCHVQIMLLFVYTTTRKGFVIFTYWAWAACVEWSRNTDGIKFSKILLSIILFPQLRIHKRGCPVSPPRWLCLSDRWKPKCLSVWSCIRDLVFCPYGKQSETVLFFCLRHLLATRKV